MAEGDDTQDGRSAAGALGSAAAPASGRDALDAGRAGPVSGREVVLPTGGDAPTAADLPTHFGLDDGDESWLARMRAARSGDAALGSLGPYDILEEAARGGQAVVYRARDRRDGRLVALKRPLAIGADAAAARARIEREIEIARELSHEGLSRCLAVETVEGRPLLVFEWIDGEPIDAWARAGRGPHAIAAAMAAVCDAVQHAHHRGVIHRDLKPANILVRPDGQPRVLDFGLARPLGPLGGGPNGTGGGPTVKDCARGFDNGGPTVSGGFLGTPAYASPEHWLGRPHAVEVRSDVYSLGAILFELLTGRRWADERDAAGAGRGPLRGDGRPRGASRPVSASVGTLSAANGSAPPADGPAAMPRDLGFIVRRALQPELAERYQTAAALAADLRAFIAGRPVSAHPPGAAYAVWKWARRRPWVAAGLLAALAMCTALLTLTLLSARAAQRSAERANLAAQNAQRSAEREHAARRVNERVGSFLSGTLAAAGASARGADATMLQVLADAARRAEAELADQPRAAAEVLLTIGETYRSLWRYRAAEPCLLRALGLARSLHLEDGPDAGELEEKSESAGDLLSRCLTAYGAVLTNLRDERAPAMHAEALAIRTQRHGAISATVAESRMRLGYALHQAVAPPRFEEAERELLAALETYRAVHAGPHRETGACLHNLGWLRYRQARYEDAAEFYALALGEFVRAGGTSDPYYAECLHGYTSLLNLLHRYEDNLAAIDTALPLIQRLYGERGAWPLHARRGHALLALGREGEGLAELRPALAGLCTELEQDEPECADGATLLRIALLQDEAANWPDTAALLDHVRQLSPSQQSRAAGLLGRLAEALGAVGRGDEAAAVLGQIAAARGRTAASRPAR